MSLRPSTSLPADLLRARHSRSCRGTCPPPSMPRLSVVTRLRETEVRQVGARRHRACTFAGLHVPVHEAARRGPHRGPPPPARSDPAAPRAGARMPAPPEQPREVDAVHQAAWRCTAHRPPRRRRSTVTMFGWRREAARRDSRMKRLAEVRALGEGGRQQLERDEAIEMQVALPRYTTPMPPRPRNASIP